MSLSGLSGLSGLGLSGGAGAWTPADPSVFLRDTFDGAAGTALASHAGEVGATWTSSTAGMKLGGACQSRGGGGSVVEAGAAWFAVASASGTPASADYSVYQWLFPKTAAGTVGPMGRASGGATWYWLQAQCGSDLVRIYKPGPVLLDSDSQVFAPVTDYVLELRMAGTSIKGLVNGVELVSATDPDISDANKAGIGGAGDYTADTGPHVLETAAAPTGTLLTFGIRLAHRGTDTLALVCPAAQGGTGPYTYQWYRSTTQGFPVTGAVPGATSVGLDDTGLAPGVTYYYRRRATDSLGAVADTAEFAAKTAEFRAVCFGNSLTAGAGSQAGVTDYPTQMEAVLNAGTPGTYWEVVRLGDDGRTTAQMVTDYPTDAAPYAAAGVPCVLVISEDTNTIFYSASEAAAKADAKADMAELVALAAADDWAAIVTTTCIARDGTGTPAFFEAARLDVNADRVANAGGVYGDAVVDLGGLPEYDATADCASSPPYSADKIHQVAAGYAIWASEIGAAVLAEV